MPEHLVASLHEVLETSPRALIGVDGKDGAGKSRLAAMLGDELCIDVIHLDDYLEKNRGAYVAFLKVGELRKRIQERTRPIIVEGICLLEALGLVTEAVPEFLVYVKRCNRHGRWLDEDECAFSGSISEFIVHQRIIGMPPIPSLEREVVAYHLAHRPHEIADHVHFRVVED